METTTTEIADGIHRISTFVAGPDLPFNQYLVVADEPLLFHAGHRQLFPLVSEAVGRIIPVESLRWITFGHVEADECGSMNSWLGAAPRAQVAHGMTAVMAPALSDADLLGPAIAAEEVFHATALTPMTAPTIRRLAELDATTLALMHGPAFTGDSTAALTSLAEYYESQVVPV